jgi:uncharacterized protein YuzE
MSERESLEQAHVSYDPQHDVLSIHFGEPHVTHDSETTDGGIIVRLREGRIVAVSILNAHRRIHEALKGQL